MSHEHAEVECDTLPYERALPTGCAGAQHPLDWQFSRFNTAPLAPNHSRAVRSKGTEMTGFRSPTGSQLGKLGV
mgnify:CR=1 FL=1